MGKKTNKRKYFLKEDDQTNDSESPKHLNGKASSAKNFDFKEESKIDQKPASLNKGDENSTLLNYTQKSADVIKLRNK